MIDTAHAGTMGARAASDDGLQDRLMQMEAAERALMEAALALPAAGNRRAAVSQVRSQHVCELQSIVAGSGWPTADRVGERCSTYALHVLLVSEDLAFQIRCRDLIREAVESRSCPALHQAYIEDTCAVALSVPQTYGTQINWRVVRPFPIAEPADVDERRAAVGLPPLEQEMAGHLARLRGEEPPGSQSTGAVR